jgi:HPt (histidine-containing phosphotransfer) domain-containing protein
MDDHIAKPINVQHMFTTLARWITPAEPVTQQTASARVLGTVEPSLPEIQGLETEVGLRIAQGNQRLYRRLLIKFRENQRDFVQQFQDARNSDDDNAAMRCAHTLKGVAGNIGAKDLQEAANLLEQMCAAKEIDDATDRQLKIVERQLTSLLSDLRALSLPELELRQTVPENKLIDKDKVTPLLKKLRLLLDDCDTEAKDVLEQLSAIDGMSTHITDIQKLTKYLDEYDFDEALTVLTHLESTLEETSNG